MYAIWDVEEQDWIRELPSKVDDGQIAVLVFRFKHHAQRRAAKHYGYPATSWPRVNRYGVCQIIQIGHWPLLRGARD